MLQDLQNTYINLTYVHDDTYWAKHIYLTKTLPEPADYLDCSFVCKNVEVNVIMYIVWQAYIFYICTCFFVLWV